MKVDFFKVEDKKRHTRLSIMRMENIEITREYVENQVFLLVSSTKNPGTEREHSDMQMLSFCFAEDLYNWNIKNSAKDN